MWLHADYNEQQYLLNPDDGDTFVSSTAINGWVWWKPTIYAIDLCVAALCAMWVILVILSVVFRKKKKDTPPAAELYSDLGYMSGGNAHESENKEDNDEHME